MEKKKNFEKIFKIIFIFAIVLFFGAGVWFGANLIFEENDEVLTASNVDRYFVAQTAVHNNEYSHNYDGVYKFSRVNYVDLSELTDEGRLAVYAYYNKVLDTMGLIKKLSDNKLNEVNKTKETLIIENGTFHINNKSIPVKQGTIAGNDDYSILIDSKKEMFASASITGVSEKQLKNQNADYVNEYKDGELYLTIKNTIKSNNQTYSFNVVYVYVAQ